MKIRKIQNLRDSRIKASTLVLVLIVVGVVAAVMVYMLSKIQVQMQQEVLERGTTTAEQQALSALDKLTKEVIQQPEVYINKQEISLNEAPLNICEHNASEKERRCGEDSRVVFDKYKEIVQYSMRNDETIQITMATKPHNTSRGIAIFTANGQTISGVSDELLVLAFKYDNNVGLKAIGECAINYGTKQVSCLGNLGVKSRYNNKVVSTSDLLNDSVASTYGPTLVEIVPINNDKVSFFRVKALLANINSTFPVSITGEINNGDIGELPEAQVIVMTAQVYSDNTGDRQTYTEYTRMIWLHPAMPEVFDWVLFNGSDNPIRK